MTEARRNCYSTGPSGDHLRALCEKWGVTEAVLQRARWLHPASRWRAWSRGEADLGFQQLSELIGQPGIEVVGPLPPEESAGHRILGRRVDRIDETKARRFSSPISCPLKPPTRNCATAWSPRRSRRKRVLDSPARRLADDDRLPRPLHHRSEGPRPGVTSRSPASRIPQPGRKRRISGSPTMNCASSSTRTSSRFMKERGADLTIFSPARQLHGAITSATLPSAPPGPRFCNEL